MAANRENTELMIFGILMGLLQFLMLTLKLLDKIDLSWTWVLAPIWFPGAVLMLIVILIGGIGD